MAIEKNGQMTYVDEAGNEYLLFPKTKPECIPGVAEHLANNNNPHGVTIAQIGAAPAGYGLGGEAKQLTSADNLNNAWRSGWYNWGASIPTNAPLMKWDGGYAFMRVDGANANNFTQTVYSAYGDSKGLHAMRVFAGGVTDGWEWVNPPMALGVEYRTTERHNSYPVYTKLVNIGALPNASGKNFEGVLPMNITPLSVDGVAKNGKNGVALPSMHIHVSVDGEWGNVYIATDADYSTQTAFVIVKYVKS